MGFLDDLFDTKIYDSKDTRIKYTPPKVPSLSKLKTTPIKHNTKHEIQRVKEGKERESAIRKCGKWIYLNNVEWCVSFKGTHIHKKCMEELFDNLDSRKGMMYCDYADTLVPEWVDYWYDSKNHRYYTRQQLKRVEKEFNKGRDSEELVCEMLQYVWFNMLDKDQLYEEIDDIGIYKLRVKWMK